MGRMIAKLQRFSLKISSLLIVSVILTEVLIQFGATCSIVNGTSMLPTLHDGDRLLVNKFHYLLYPPSQGDVITFEDPIKKGHYLVKRVIGVSGDVIEIKNGIVRCNGINLKEHYIDTKIEDGDYGPIRVKPGTVFVMGDNRHRYASRDSRYPSIGLVPFRFIEGKVEFILWRPSFMIHL